ncbi:TPA: helix-turn-helix domain-containing protein [Vibrio parahaemolyticus]
MALGQRVRDQRIKNKMTQKDLAQKAGISQQVISKLEATDGTHSRFVYEIAVALGCDVAWLASGKNKNKAAIQ